MIPNNVEYQSYLLRVWRTRQADRWVWRATLQGIPDGSIRGFASLADLLAALDPASAVEPADLPKGAILPGDAAIIEDPHLFCKAPGDDGSRPR